MTMETEKVIHFTIRMALTILLTGAWVESGFVAVWGWLALLNLILMVFWGISALVEEEAK